MPRTSDALELLTAQHEELSALLSNVATVDDDRRALALCELADKLTTHLAVEQELLVIAPDPDHEELKRVMAELVALDVAAVATSPLLGELATLLERHTRAQDDVLFVQIAELVPETALRDLGEQLREQCESTLCIAA